MNDLPSWPGAVECYRKAYQLLERMAKNGHVRPARIGRRGRILAPCAVSSEMTDLIEALNTGDEERIKAALLWHNPSQTPGFF